MAQMRQNDGWMNRDKIEDRKGTTQKTDWMKENEFDVLITL